MSDQTTTKIRPRSLALARLISEKTGERQYRLFERLVEVEAKRLRIKLPSTTKAKEA